MWTTLALMTLSMAPAQASEPDFKNPRYTYGLLGQTRKDDKFLPGDVVTLTFDVDNLKVKNDGRILYAMGMEVTKKGEKKPVFSRESEDREVINALGGARFPAFARWPIPRDSEAPGEYTIKITVKDRSVEKAKPATLTQKFTVVKTQLGFIQVYLTTVLQGEATPPVGVPGQKIALSYTLVGFETEKEKKQSDLTVTIRILDENGKETLAKPNKGDIKGNAKSAPGVMVMSPYLIDLNRPGKFKVEIKVTDNVARKSADLSLDLNVIDIAK